MVEHLILAVKMGDGKLKLECINPPDKLPTLKKFLMSSRLMPKDFVNPAIGSNNLPLHFSSLEEAISKLMEESEDYSHYFDENPDTKPVNVTFGGLNKDEWDHFHKKHFTHHLEHFGLL
jgi:oxepin-CoA hydrolase/3-oxo-5,6-dehydrosuberyl-CoA semialdehyde dehydrogenase